jgi:hypothetical protein
MTREYIDVVTAGGTIAIDLTETMEQGYIDDCDVDTSGAAVLTVRDCIRDGSPLIDAAGRPTFIVPNAPLAFTYYSHDDGRLGGSS